MNIAVIGTGYVGLVTGACLADLGVNVVCMDNDEEKIGKLKRGIIPIYEPGLAEIVQRNYGERLNFTSEIGEAVQHGEAIFIAVGTPSLDDYSADLQYVFSAVREIARCMEDYKVIIDKSTVPIGTGRRVREEIGKVLAERSVNINFDIVSNPEFLREGSAVMDFINPDRIVVGVDNEKSLEVMKRIYNAQLLMNIPLVVTNIETAEMIKYASNAFLAAKVSFINDIANMCELCGADVVMVAKAMGMDSRIGPKFLNAGPGFGGSCFPKDTKALIGIGRAIRYVPKIVKSTIEVNDRQKRLMFNKIKSVLGKLKNRTVTILGIAFKPETDDIRESPALYIMEQLVASGARVKAYDPQAMENTKSLHPKLEVQYCEDVYSACEDTDCIVLVTEWEEFCSLDFRKLADIVHSPILIDLRNIYEPDFVRNAGFIYQGVGRK
ncbi:MAG: UDP-glucose/GDP-mannose dehydrogenase family protein [Clostridia bacterium]|nr:UDP-glucose/GDP-mannose dehydrogenase family protein [Clostridia bacterium]